MPDQRPVTALISTYRYATLPPMFHIGDVIRKLREARGWSQPDLAKHAKTGIMTVSEIERGVRSNPGKNTLDKLAQALGLDDASELYRMASDQPRQTSKGASLTSRGVPHHGAASGSLEEIFTELREIASRVFVLATLIQSFADQGKDQAPKPPRDSGSSRRRSG